MRRTISAMAIAMVLLLGACGDDDEGAATTSSVDVPTSSTAAPASSSSTTTDDGEAPTTTTGSPGSTLPAGDVPEVALAADGLVLDGEASQSVTFGAAEAEVLDALGAALGEPDATGPEEECPAGPAEFARYSGAGLSLTFQGGSFVGWSARPNAILETVEGIGVGSTVGDLSAAYPDTSVEESSLGWEFSGGGLHGVASGNTDDGVVETMWAGTTCIFR